MYIVQSGGQWPPFSSMFVYRDHPQQKSFQSPTELFSKERSSPKRSFPKRLPQQRSTTQTITWVTEINPTKIIPIYVDHPNPQQRLPQQNQQKLIMPYNVCFSLCHQIFVFFIMSPNVCFYYVTKWLWRCSVFNGQPAHPVIPCCGCPHQITIPNNISTN